MRELESFARILLGQLPTPLHRLDNISGLLGRSIYIKRDDMTGVAYGGNKVRKLEYLLADAIAAGANAVITTGGPQSNHAMLTAACCNRLGLECHLVLKGRGVTGRKGNLILDDLLGVPVTLVDSDSYADVYAEMERVAGALRAEGKAPYSIPVGGSVPLGTLGYVACAREIAEQAAARELRIDDIICTTGSGGTHAGLALGAALCLPGASVTGIAVSDEPFERMVAGLIADTARLMETDVAAPVNVEYRVGEGYAIASPEGVAAMRLMAEQEGIILDPVYTGKAFSGLLALAREDRLGENVLFLHSGGAGGTFAIDF